MVAFGTTLLSLSKLLIAAFLVGNAEKLRWGSKFVHSMRMAQLAMATPARHCAANDHLCNKNKVYVRDNIVGGCANKLTLLNLGLPTNN